MSGIYNMADRSLSHSYEHINYMNPRLKRSTPSTTPNSVCVSTRVCITALLFSVLCNGLLLGYAVHKFVHIENFPRSSRNVSNVSGSVCVSCDMYNVPVAVGESFTTEVKANGLGQGSSLCCLKHSEGLGRLISLFSGQHYSNKDDVEAKDTLTSQTPTVHLYIDTDRIKEKHLPWSLESGFGTARVSGDIDFSNDSFTVPRDGVYNVYSFLTVKTDVMDGDLNLLHSVKRLTSHENAQVLLLNKMTVQDKRGPFTTSFLQGNLKLKSKDKLFVEFSNPLFIYRYPPANYFGLYQL